jgi:cytochrome oxidase Cu insertion factor (SCO1/SenC/PrrC family)
MKALLEKRIFAVCMLVIAALVAGIAGYSTLRPERMAVSSGTALVGGPFTLTSHQGKHVTSEDFRGKYMLVTFGYTYCPDVCPTELQIVSAALDLLGERAKDIQPIFITIDPERDTVAALAQYMPNFHPRYMGLTGSPDQIEAVAKAYRVYYAKAQGQGGGDYLMDHSSIIYLMDKQGTFIKHFSYGTDAKQLAEGIAAAIDSQ